MERLASLIPRHATGLESGVTVLTPAAGARLLFLEPAGPELRNDLPAAAAWVARNRPALEHLLGFHGAIILRGFPAATSQDFAALIGAFRDFDGDYTGGATPRDRIAGNVYEATRADAERTLRMHQEMAYLPRHPDMLAFFCRIPAQEGGETTVADMREFTAAAPASLIREIEARGIRYVRNFRAPDTAETFVDPIFPGYHKTWEQAFYTADKARIEGFCRRNGLDFAWDGDGSLTIVHTAPGFVTHPASGERIWFNTITSQLPNEALYGAKWPAFQDWYRDRPKPYDVRFGDGSPIDTGFIPELNRTMEGLVRGFAWQTGDVMLLDNVVSAHGRQPYSGDRDVQVILLSRGG